LGGLEICDTLIDLPDTDMLAPLRRQSRESKVIEAKVLAFFVAVVAVCALCVVYQKGIKRAVARTLAGREPVPAPEFGTRYYSDRKRAEIATFIVAKLEELTGYQLTGVLPSDRIIADLRIDELDSLATVEIITEVESQFTIKITNEEAAQAHTIAEFVELVAAKTSGR
jgi:acyl carrier protein